MATTGYAHIELAEDGTPRIAGTRFTVAAIAALHTREEASAEEIQQASPSLTPAEVHSSLAYYYDHKEQVERQIDEDRQELDALRALWADSQARLRADLRARGNWGAIPGVH